MLSAVAIAGTKLTHVVVVVSSLMGKTIGHIIALTADSNVDSCWAKV
jgi:hypothetical protein